MSEQPPAVETDLREYLRSFRTDTLQIVIYMVQPVIAGWLFLLLSQVSGAAGTLGIVLLFTPLAWFAVTSLLAWLLLRQQRFELARLLFYLCLLVTPYLQIVLQETPNNFVAYSLLLPVILAGVLSSPLLPFRIAALNLVLFIAIGLGNLFRLFEPRMFNSFNSYMGFFAGPTFLLLLAAVASWLATRDLVSTMQWAMESHRLAERRAERLSASEIRVARTLLELEGTHETQTRLNSQLQLLNSELELARQSADEANTLKTRFLANMSHELRTPLNAIINFTQFMSKPRYGAVTERQRELQERVIFNSEHLLGLINDILDLSKIEAGRMELQLETFDVVPIITGVMATAVGLTKSKGLELETDLDEELAPVRGDKVRVRQILLNLLSNAAKFTDEGCLTVRAFERNGMVQISVADTGTGIPPEDLHLVFEEFHQVEQAASSKRLQGTGLGLPISNQLVQLQSGTMWVESEQGVGSIFSFTLPVGNPSAEAAVIIFDPAVQEVP